MLQQLATGPLSNPHVQRHPRRHHGDRHHHRHRRTRRPRPDPPRARRRVRADRDLHPGHAMTRRPTAAPATSHRLTRLRHASRAGAAVTGSVAAEVAIAVPGAGRGPGLRRGAGRPRRRRPAAPRRRRPPGRPRGQPHPHPDRAPTSAAQQTATASLAGRRRRLRPNPAVSVDTSDFQPGGVVTVTVSCRLDLSDAAALLAIGSSRTLTATASLADRHLPGSDPVTTPTPRDPDYGAELSGRPCASRVLGDAGMVSAFVLAAMIGLFAVVGLGLDPGEALRGEDPRHRAGRGSGPRRSATDRPHRLPHHRRLATRPQRCRAGRAAVPHHRRRARAPSPPPRTGHRHDHHRLPHPALATHRRRHHRRPRHRHCHAAARHHRPRTRQPLTGAAHDPSPAPPTARATAARRAGRRACRRASGRVIVGLAAAGLLAGLLVGVPYGLWHWLGWPLPHRWPTWHETRDTLTGPFTDRILLDTLACLCWIVWAVFLTDVARALPDTLRDARHHGAGRAAANVHVRRHRSALGTITRPRQSAPCGGRCRAAQHAPVPGPRRPRRRAARHHPHRDRRRRSANGHCF